MILRDVENADTGTIRIHDNVISSIASLAAEEIEGVKGIDKNLKSGLLEMFNHRSGGSIRIEKDANGDITVSVPLVIKYGYNIPEVSSRVQDNIRAALERMVNISVKDIIVSVQAVERG